MAEVGDSSAISRRDVLKGAAAGAALTAGAALGLRGAPAEAQGKSDDKAGRSGALPDFGDDFRFVNGRFVDGRGVVASAISVKDGRIVAVGQPTGGGAARTINLHGRTVIPGFNDAHTHFTRAGCNPGWQTRWVETAFSIEELLQVIADHAVTVPPGEFITCRGGWRPTQFAEQRLPTRSELDDAAPQHPVYLHAAVGGAATNSIGASFFEGRGISVSATGVVSAPNPAFEALRSVQTFEDKVRGTADAIAYAAATGLTTIQDQGNLHVQPGDYSPMNALYHRNGRRLDVRIRHHRYSTTVTPDELETYMDPIFREAGDDTYRIGGVGEEIGSHANFEEALRRVARAQWRVTQHYHGPVAAEQVDAFHKVGTEFDVRNLHWSYSHPQLLTAQQMQSLISVGMGAILTRGPFRTFVDSGMPVGVGTDATNSSPLNPWLEFYFMVTGQTHTGSGGLEHPGQEISRLEALHAYTLGSAWFSRQQHELGSFDVGKLADIAVLSDDLLAVSDEQLRKITSLLTLQGGRVVHATNEFASLQVKDEQPFPDTFPGTVEVHPPTDPGNGAENGPNGDDDHEDESDH